jgi:hypothetical protein
MAFTNTAYSRPLTVQHSHAVHSVWPGGWAPRRVCTAPSARPEVTANSNTRRPQRQRREPTRLARPGQAAAMKANPDDARPPGKQPPGPPSVMTHQAHCDT